MSSLLLWVKINYKRGMTMSFLTLFVENSMMHAKSISFTSGTHAHYLEQLVISENSSIVIFANSYLANYITESIDQNFF